MEELWASPLAVAVEVPITGGRSGTAIGLGKNHQAIHFGGVHIYVHTKPRVFRMQAQRPQHKEGVPILADEG